MFAHTSSKCSHDYLHIYIIAMSNVSLQYVHCISLSKKLKSVSMCLRAKHNMLINGIFTYAAFTSNLFVDGRIKQLHSWYGPK